MAEKGTHAMTTLEETNRRVRWHANPTGTNPALARELIAKSGNADAIRFWDMRYEGNITGRATYKHLMEQTGWTRGHMKRVEAFVIRHLRHYGPIAERAASDGKERTP